MTDDDAERRSALSPILTTTEFRPLTASVRPTIGARSHSGVVRDRNEDHFLVLRLGRDQETLATSLPAGDAPARFEEHGYAMLVADGLGEGGGGAVASRVALSAIAHLAIHFGKWNVRIDPSVASEIFERAEWFYAQADAAIRARVHSTPELKGMTSALTVAYSAGTDLFVAHVGHTRAYQFRDGQLTRLTRDQTLEQHLADTRRPASVERRAQDLQHILTDAVGAAGAYPFVDVERFELRDGDCVLLCTNGLTDMLSDEEIGEILALRRQASELCDLLIDRANRAGGADNITVIVAEYRIPPR